MRTAYTFSVLRYVHDPVTQEFLNIGIAVYSAQTGYLRAKCTTHYRRITRTFTRIDGERFRQMTRFIEERLTAVGKSLKSELPFESGRTIEHLLARVLPHDDSSIQFAPAGGGLSQNLDQTTEELYERYVERYTPTKGVSRRDDDEVWRTFREALDKRHISAHLGPKRILAPDYDYEFERAWKNGIWHVYEPVSFDLTDGGSILDKANRWLGRATSLNDSSETFQLHLLLGEPQDERLHGTFLKAENILRKMPGRHELISEREAEAFAEELEREMREHKRAS
ncbi:MAG: DUF3037 domain-containing protein [Bryobacteraceae bacterium]|nr:DUF3037 domain-containing protein [Bryobacteraceae bacterium]